MTTASLYENVKKFIQSLLLIVVLLASLTGSSLPAAQAQAGNAPELFSAATDIGNAADKATPDFVTRSRFVNVDLGLLFDADGQTRDASALPEIQLNLFPDLNYTGVVDRVEKNSEFSHSWIGKLKENEKGYFYLVVSDGVFIAHIASPEGVYEISSAGGDLYQVVQIDQSKLPQEDIWNESDYVAPLELNPADLPPNADSGSTIDVMVVYTQSARAAEGSAAAMNTRIDLAMTETNTAYANAGVTPRLRLVYRGEVAYAESGDIGVDVGRLAATADGYMDQVHTLRNIYKADMVALIVENGGGYCGIADAIMATAATAFDVTARSGCMTGYYSFGHEFGHLQGARHDTYVDPTNTPYAYGHGYVYIPSRWRTVMAYNTLCADTSPYTYCNRLQYFSNPGVNYGGVPMGVTGTNQVYQVLNSTAVTVANFRSSYGYTCLQAVPHTDYDGDCKSDIAVYRPSTGQWFIKDYYSTTWGVSGDIPVPGDYNGGGSTDVAVYRPSTGQWFVQYIYSTTWGVSGDIPVPGDYNGDGYTDVAVYRPSTGQWFIKDQFATTWGLSSDIPVPADYNVDGKTDIAIYRPSTGQWFVKDIGAYTWGVSGDIPVVGDYTSTYAADLAIFRPSTGQWFAKDAIDGATYAATWGLSTDTPISGDYNGGGATDFAIYRSSTGQWFSISAPAVTWGVSGDIPLSAKVP